MSPEHARGLPTDERADLYSLGCILFKMLSGRVPYSGGSLMDVLFKHVSAAPPPLESPFGELPPALEALVHRCLAKHPEDRPQSASDLREGLDALWPILPREADPRA
jgi:serine/threonine-protein kinase